MLAGFPIPVASGVGNPVLHEDAGDAYICQPLAYVGTFESDCAVLANRQCLEAAAREYEDGDPLRADLRAVQKERRMGQGIFLVGKLPYSILQRSEEHTSELQSIMRISYAVFCLKKKKKNNRHQ